MDRSTHVEPRRITFGAYLVDEWLPAAAIERRPTTVASYKDLITRLVIPALETVPLGRLSPVQLTASWLTES